MTAIVTLNFGSVSVNAFSVSFTGAQISLGDNQSGFSIGFPVDSLSIAGNGILISCPSPVNGQMNIPITVSGGTPFITISVYGDGVVLVSTGGGSEILLPVIPFPLRGL